VLDPEPDEVREQVDVCSSDPGHRVTLTVHAKLRTLVDALMGDAELGDALRQRLIVLEGDREPARRFEAQLDNGRHAGQMANVQRLAE
jgi:hypothetical protein